MTVTTDVWFTLTKYAPIIMMVIQVSMLFLLFRIFIEIERSNTKKKGK